MSHTIPHTETPHPDTGWTNGRLGMWLFLASELMLFAGVYAGFLLMRFGTPDWPSGREILNLPVGAVNTVILLGSTVFVWGATRIAERRPRLGRLLMLCATAGYLQFLLMKWFFEYNVKIEQGLLPSTNNFLAVYWTLTGLHALHVLGGIVVNLHHIGPPSRHLAATHPRRWANRLSITALYWYFVDAVWLVLFPSLYLW